MFGGHLGYKNIHLYLHNNRIGLRTPFSHWLLLDCTCHEFYTAIYLTQS